MQNYKIWMKKAGSLFLCCILSGVGCISCNNAKSSIQTKQTENTQSGFSCGSGELTDIANYIGSPVKLRYIQDGETHNECEITDKQTVDSCMNALQTLQIGKEIEVRTMDAGETFLFEFKDGKKIASAIECKEHGVEKGIVLTENDLVFVTNGSCTEGTIYGDQNHAPNGDAEVRTSGCWNLWKNIAKQDPSFGHPEKFCSDITKTNWESATVTTLDDKIIPYITDICKRDPKTGNVVTGGIVSCVDSNWLLSWTINRQGQFKTQDKDKVCVWVYGLFTDKPGNFVKKPMRECTGKEITEEWLYHLGVPTDQIPELAENSAVCVPTMMPYITAFFMPRTKGDRPDVIPDGCVNFAFLGQFADTPRDTVFTTEYSVRTAMEAVYGLLGVDRGVPEVWGSVYDIRELLDSSVKLMDGKSPLDIQLPGPLNALKKPLLHVIHGTVVEKVLQDHDIIR